MCGRFVITLPHDAMAQLFVAAPANDLPSVPNYNVCPTDRVCTVVFDGGRRRLIGMRWGFLPHWAKSTTDGPPLINARAETVAEKPAFRASIRDRRCLVPADGFYEWTRSGTEGRLPWHIHREDSAPMVMAGVWRDWEQDGDRISSVAIVTCAAEGPMADLHHRMPVILEPADWPLWLGEEGKGAARLMRSNRRLIAYRVDPAVNSNRAKGPELLQPV